MFDPADWPDYSATAALYRNPAASGGTVTAPARVRSVVGVLVPASSFSGAALPPPPDGLDGARYDLAFICAGTAVRAGDELRVTGRGALKVHKVDRWDATTVAWTQETS